MTRQQYQQLVRELNAAHRYGNTLDRSAVYAMASLRRARSLLVEIGRPS